MIDDFKAAFDRSGLSTKEKIIPDGRMHRFHIEGDRPGSKNGWYVLYGDGLPSGAFGSWKTGFKGTWYAKPQNTLTPAERRDFSDTIKKAEQQRAVEESNRRAEARNKALSIWKAAMPAPDDHPYLVKKGVGNHGLRISRAALMIPLRDSVGALHSLQFIDGEGNKRFFIRRAQERLLFRHRNALKFSLHRRGVCNRRQHL
ncbi:MAG: hypothetical protein LRY39_01225 [Alphaproteobacteria bacterium]|nr:hypothetical protein [Alphaproteobacteria bacterium]